MSLVGHSVVNISRGRLRRGCKNNIRMDLKESIRGLD